jgi:hypothetical protein
LRFAWALDLVVFARCKDAGDGVVVFSLLPSSCSQSIRLVGSFETQTGEFPSSRAGRLFADAQKRPGRKAIRLGTLLVAGLFLMMFALPAFAADRAYYINNRPGSNCSDGGPHTLAQPWCTFAPVNKIGTFAPGDRILLARGASWNQEMSLRGRGTANEPITLGAYGSGPNPKILRNQAVSDICVLLTDANYWDISDLEVGRASVGILLHYTQPFNNGVNISNIYVHDNKGIWGSYSTEYPVSRKVLDPFATSLNINLSSGILFNIASHVKFSASQYVLKGVTVNNVRGRNNVDSVAFDAEANTIDNQDGHNAFQDVLLDDLVFSSDNGHAADPYQRAGLGCSDSLRLLGMTNVTLMNSVLFDEAACHTPTGTSAVILGRVSKIKFINNIFFGVPASDSPDETAIDFEWSEDQVDLDGNLFAANAGAGVEILNIHPGDHTTAIDFSGNTFAQNAYSHRPGAASVWEDNNGHGYGTPTGKIRNNLYFEEHGRFLDGRNIKLIADANELQTTTAANYAAEQFSGTQGKHQWHYMYELADSTWSDMTLYSGSVANGAWRTADRGYVSAFYLAPAPCTGSCKSGGVARAWVAPHAGIVSIRGVVLQADGNGSRVNAAIKHVSGHNVTQIWPSTGEGQLINGSDQLGHEANADDIQVSEGDVIRFEVYGSGDHASEAVSWTPSIGYIDRRSPSHSQVSGAAALLAIPGSAPAQGQPADEQDSQSAKAEFRTVSYSTRSASTGLNPAARRAGR